MGAILLGKITYGEVSLGGARGKPTGGPPCPAKSQISFVIPPAAKVCYLFYLSQKSSCSGKLLVAKSSYYLSLRFLTDVTC